MRRRWVGWTIGAAVIFLIFSIGWVVFRGGGAVIELQSVKTSASQLREAIAEGDLVRAERIAPRIEQHAATAHDLTDDFIWRGFEFVPWLGPNFTAVREVAAIADSVAADAMTPVLAAADDIDLSAFGFSGGSLDLEPLAAIEQPLSGAAEVLAEADLRAQQIDADATLEPLADAVGQMRDVVTETAAVVGTMHGASVLLPTMLGGDGPRYYLVAMQNNAELRSEGGIVGALALVKAEYGSITLIRQASTSDFPTLTDPLPVSESTTALFDDRAGRFMQNATSIPDFTEAAPLLAQRWEDRFGQQVDGVVAVDAIVARHLVEAAGDVSFAGYTVTAETIIPLLLSEVYAAVPDPKTQDAVFANAAGALLAIALTDSEPQSLLSALATSASEDRIRIWSTHEDEQAVLAASTLAGALPRDGERGTYVGVLFNDATGGKMDYYTDASIDTAVGVCHGEPTTQVRVTWTNNAPADAAETLPPYVTANGAYDVEPGSVRTLIAVYGPEGATVQSFDRDGSEDQVQTASLDDRSVVQHDVTLAPGESTTITVSFIGSGAGERLTRVQHTPMITTPDTTRSQITCD